MDGYKNMFPSNITYQSYYNMGTLRHNKKSATLKAKHLQQYRSESALDKINSTPCKWTGLLDNTRKELAKEAMLYMLKDTISPRYGTVNHKQSNNKQEQTTKQDNQDKVINTISKNNDEYYLLQMYEILKTPLDRGPTFHQSPAPVTEYMYMGGYSDAKDIKKLKRIGITHVVNLAAFWEDRNHNPYPPQSGITSYEAFNAEDNEAYPILMHYPAIKKIIDRARWTNGKVLIHCAMGINRSGAICCAYLIDGLRMDLIEAVNLLHRKRGTVLRNIGFQQKLVGFARERGHLS